MCTSTPRKRWVAFMRSETACNAGNRLRAFRETGYEPFGEKVTSLSRGSTGHGPFKYVTACHAGNRFTSSLKRKVMVPAMH